VPASDSLTSSLLLAGWLGVALGLYALGDSLVALFGVSVIRESGARLEDIRQLSRHARADGAYGWQSWIVSFGGAAAPWARVVLAIGCGVAVVCGVI
jgi:hypothetical protein